MRQSRSCVVSGVRAEVSLASGSSARQHKRPPELRVKDGGSPILPTVWPLAWIALFLFWWSLAIVQCRPTWAPPEPLPVQKCRGRLQIPQTPPGLPPLVFADQSSGWCPPTTPRPNPPRRMGREDNCFASGSASLGTPLRRAFAVSQMPSSCATQYVADWVGGMAHGMVRSGMNTLQQQRPRALQIRGCWDGSPKLALFLNAFRHLPGDKLF